VTRKEPVVTGRDVYTINKLGTLVIGSDLKTPVTAGKGRVVTHGIRIPTQGSDQGLAVNNKVNP
jgi:hypothetical protein